MRPRPLVAPIALGLAALLLGACRTAEPVPVGVAAPDAEQIHRDIAYLADDRLEGRGTGTAGNDSAAAYLARRLSALGLRPLVIDTTRSDCRGAAMPAWCRIFVQRFTARSAEMAHAGRAEGVPTQNVVALVPGRDPALRGEYVVIGAHFD